ncbi:ubiquitin carboxyl-terminal hydrolase 15-like isoform X2 [Gossypium arboreum]|uniref:ubiquitin carboxyl-terminal hydrolase 15-like isoform X2 n=1 Tax=Gossypium arboreum TaxID=29729 RepID=UPI0022F1C69E|nr:ubiquitin carboxyl-terminal hydrolase 15-like isoform X2 [Gossypium arboreum]
MLEPREADIPALFLVLVVLPLVTYFLLGKWSEVSKKRDKVSLLAHLAAEEALRAETMAAASVIPVVPVPKKGLHVCARCFGPSTTRCSRCKAVRYCSGRCQIIHWRQVHKEECLQLESGSVASFEESVLHSDNMDSRFLEYINKQAAKEKTSSDNINHCPTTTSLFANGDCSTIDTSQGCAPERSAEKRVSRKSNGEVLRREDVAIVDSCEETLRTRTTSLTINSISSKEAFRRHKSRTSGFVVSEDGMLKQQNPNGSNMLIHGQNVSTAMHDGHKHQSQRGNMSEPKSNYEFAGPPYSAKGGTSAHEAENAFVWSSENIVNGENAFSGKSVELECSGMATAKECTKSRSSSQSVGPKISKSPKSTVKVSGERLHPEMERKGQIPDELNDIPAPGINGAANTGIMEMMGLRKSSKLARQDFPALYGNRRKKIKMLFPYEEFVNFFQCEVFDLSPRGLLNCGNSCYANAVLQCLTCTKPLSIYLLHGSHSRICYRKDRCLMCELEQHVMLLRECGGPLSPSRILSHIRTINCQMGDGSQEDAHEFLRLLVASMQSICLERLGGEQKVDPRLQETTFIQHTFGGRLWSKVKCLRCSHESERFENILDLTLEIYGWVESLEDALTQFTTPEDLDGENMYRCGRCAGYARARKQLRIHEAPNILTIVLKRFQVHPVSMSQVMSEDAYILFYTRSYPRPQRAISEKIKQVPARHLASKMEKPTRPAQSKSSSHSVGPKLYPDTRSGTAAGYINRDSNGILRQSANSNIHRVVEMYAEPSNVEFSDATSSDWSLFTSSDEASFTTESTRDSFSTVDYTDTSNGGDPFSIFNNLYTPESSSCNTVSCSMFSTSRPHTRYVLEEKGYVLDSYSSAQLVNQDQVNFNQVCDSLTDFSLDTEHGMFVKYGSNPKNAFNRTSSAHCEW